MVAATLALATAAAGSTAAGADRVKAPRSGAKYSGVTGDRGKLTLYISGKSVQLVGFRFACDKIVGSTSLEAIKLKRSKTGYRFKINAHSSVTYSDNRPDQNAAVFIEGRFSRSAKHVAGRLRVGSPRCHTPYVKWRARR